MTHNMERREFCRSLGAIPFFQLAGAQVVPETRQVQTALGGARFVAAGQDRTGTPIAHGFSSLGYKVSAQDTHGGLFVMEHAGLAKGGGPPRHLHHEQEEWFYLLEGEMIVEIGKERTRLKAGDAVLAPREVPHAYLYVAEKPGRLLIAFAPAGKLEAFFRDTRPHDAKVFHEYGMELVGPSLTLEEAAGVGG